MTRTLVLLLSIGFAAGCSDEPVDTASTSVVDSLSATTVPVATTAGAIDLAELGFGDFVEDSYRLLLARDPEHLTALGIADEFGMRNDQLNDYSEPFTMATETLESAILDQLRGFDRSKLEPADRLSYDVYEWYLDQQVRGHRFRYHDWPVHYFVNAYNTGLMLFFQEVHPMDTLTDAEDYIARLGQIPRQVSQVLDGLRTREAMGILPPKGIVEWTIGSLTNDLKGGVRLDLVDASSLLLFTVFEERLALVDGIDARTRDDLLARALQAVETGFAQAWIELRAHMIDVLERAPDEAGVWRLPDGDAFYSHLLRENTSTELTPSQVHQMGLVQVERVQTEMREAFDALGYRSSMSLPASISRAYGEAGSLDGTTSVGREQLLALHNTLIDGAEAKMRPLFDRWPEASVDVIPDRGGGGFYVSASLDGSRPGLFHAGAGERVWLMSLPTINYHEAVPGHHTQIALAQELDLPLFRRFIQYNAYAEGWALYAERLAGEVGLYAGDPHGNIGRLELELLRAVRLVVDTGIHFERWSQKDAHAYMDEVIPTWTHEVERYMVLPGQATGYMVGQQEILRVRSEMEESMGEGFDLAAFHAAVLESGSLPLALLEDVVFESVMGD
jgi:uncharacterized protein (DUF885 family)